MQKFKSQFMTGMASGAGTAVGAAFVQASLTVLYRCTKSWISYREDRKNHTYIS